MLPVITHFYSVTAIKSPTSPPPLEGSIQTSTIYLDRKGTKANIPEQLAMITPL